MVSPITWVVQTHSSPDQTIPTDGEGGLASLSEAVNTLLLSSTYSSQTNFQFTKKKKNTCFLLFKWKLCSLKIGIEVKMRKALLKCLTEKKSPTAFESCSVILTS